MLHIATVHHLSPRWVEIQARYLRANLSVPYRTWASLEGIDAAYGAHFDTVIEQQGPHSGKLNHLAMEIEQEADDADLMMFIDPDAFPIADPMATIESALAEAPLLAVQRTESHQERHPHPCFCVTTVGAWREIPGDWSEGPVWVDDSGDARTGPGSALLLRLQAGGRPWRELRRSNAINPDPVLLAIYGEIVYHHGSLDANEAMNGDGALQQEAQERLALAERFYGKISAGGDEWLEELR